ncbi:MAG: Protein Thf1 [Synechococcus sp. CC9902]|nr:MAG: Protein Thf1 [Synechococcus sp. CC9902]
MAGTQTIADSKRAFHQAFPHVIAPLHRRIADELLVELHLLSHQDSFQAGQLFSVGLVTVFTRFTKGYRPEEHRDDLLAAICSSNGFDVAQIKSEAEGSLAEAAGQTGDKFNSWIKKLQLPEQSHYSRLMAVGLLAMMEAAHGELKGEDAAELRKKAVEISKQIGMPEARVEKDLGIFAASSERMEQAVELMEETLAAERRKKEKRMAEAAEKKQAQSA